MQPYPCPTAIPPPWHFDPHGTNTCLDIPLGEIPVLDDGLPSLRITAVGILGYQHRNFYVNRLGQEPLGAPTSDCR